MTKRDDAAEKLASPQFRARLPLLQLVRLYLDPLALFKCVTVGSAAERAAARRYNREHRGVLLQYLRRWTVIALGCLASVNPLASAAGADPVLCVPFVGVELGFAVAVCAIGISAAVYIVLGIDQPAE